MLICKGDTSYKCSEITTSSVGITQCIDFSILEPISQTDVVNLLEGDEFYFYDDVLNGRMVETNDKKVVGLSITYNADSTCEISIKLIKGDGDNES